MPQPPSFIGEQRTDRETVTIPREFAETLYGILQDLVETCSEDDDGRHWMWRIQKAERRMRAIVRR